MPTYCAVPLCKGSGGFKFPTDPDLNFKWRVAIKRFGKKKSLWKPSPHSTVCAKHFTSDDYKEPLVSYAHLSGRKRLDLRPNAVPSVFEFPKPTSASSSGRAERLKSRAEKKAKGQDMIADSAQVVQESEPGNFF